MKRFLRAALAVVTVLALTACGIATPPSEPPASTADPSAAAPPAGSAPVEAGQTWEELGLQHPLQDLRVRQALAYAIDMDSIIEGIFQGKAEAATSMTSPGDWLATGLNEYKYDPEAAKALLAEANWPADYTLDVVYYYADQQTVDLMTVIGQFWQEVGVKAEFRKLEGDLGSQLWTPPADRVNGPSEVKWDLAYAAVAALTEDEFYSRLASTAPNNSHLPKQEGLDEQLKQIMATADMEQQKEATKTVQKIISENEYLIPLYHQVAFIYSSDKLDMKGNPVGNEQYTYENNILDWTINRDNKTLYTNTGPTEFFEVTSLNPGLNIYQDLLFDRLINADNTLTPTDGLLAKSYSYNDDQTVLTLEMRDDAKWHDGQPVTAEDVKFTFELYMKTPAAASNLTDAMNVLKGAEAFLNGSAEHIEGLRVDGNNIVFEMEAISPNLLVVLSQWPVLPSHLLTLDDATNLQQNQFWQKPVGSGPFRFEEFVPNTYATLKRWDGYYKQGSGNIETVYMYAGGDGAEANTIKNMEAGMIDYAWGKNTDDAQAAEKLDFMTVTSAKIRYTRLFYINQYPHEANIK